MPISASLKPSTQQRPGMLSWNDFSGGLNADHAAWPLALAENELSDVLNYKYVRQGNLVKLKSRDGLTKASTAGVAGGAIYDYYNFVTSAGVAYDVVAADSDLKYLNAGAFTKIGDLASTRGRMCQLNNKLVIADGGTLKYWDGTTFNSFSDQEYSLIDYLDNYTPGSYFAIYSGNVTRIGTKITLTKDIATSSISFRLWKYGSPTGNATAVIYASDGSTVVGTSNTLDVSTVAAYPGANYNITFATPVALSSGSSYYFVITFSGGDADNYIALFSCADVGENLFQYTGSWSTEALLSSVMAIYGSAPQATFAVQKQNRIYVNHSAYPNRLYYCNTNDPNDWSTTNGAGFIIFDGHYKLNGAYVFYDEIYVFADQPKAVYKLSGDSPDEYALKLMWRDITAISQDVIQNVGSDLIFLDSRGVISLRTMEQYGDIEKAIISRDKVNNTYVLPYSSQVSGKTISDNQYWLSTTSNYVLIYDQEQGNWTRFQLELGTIVTPTCFGANAGVTYIGCSDGNLYYLDYTKDQDNGVDFNLIAKTNWHDFGVLFDKDARFIDSVVISANNETYDLEIYVNLNTATPLKTLSLVSLSQNGAFQSPYCGNLNEINFNFKQIQAKVTAIVSGTGPHWIDRIVVEAAILSHY